MTLPTIEAALYAQLTGDPGVAALAGDRVYSLQAPADVARPYVVFYLASGLLDRRTARLDTNEVYRVEAVADSRSGADQLRRAIFDALDQAIEGVPGFSVFWCAAERSTALTEMRDKAQVWRYITDYRIRASAQGG